MLSGILVACIWAAVLLLAMTETALYFASRAKLEEAIEDIDRRERYVKYLDRAGPARYVCVGVRVLAICGTMAILAGWAIQKGTVGTVYVIGGAVALVVAEMAGRIAGKSLSTFVLIFSLPVLQVCRILPGSGAGGEEGKPQESGEKDEKVVDAAMEEIRVAIRDATTEGAIHADEKDMIEGVLEFEDVQAHELMSPRTEIECLEADLQLNQALKALADFHHTRIPVYEEVRDKMVGVLHLKDLVPVLARDEGGDIEIRELVQHPYFVPETKRAVSLLRDFKQRHIQIAIILDEYGGVTGLVTLEDIMEQIVGELEEGFEAENIEDRIRALGSGALDVDARLHVDEVNDLMGANIPEDEDYDTIGGFLLAQFASVPEEGEELRHDGLRIKVLQSNNRRVHRVMIQRTEDEEEE